ncbi:hypothetical protein [Microcoleus sp. B4-C1]|uniref:hypothetical protein n=1 Tax=Microcoleus sp. B4-C1 TaxID=2818660 RepID=UPI002FD168E2
MPYFQACELLLSKESTVEELLEAHEDIACQYGHITCTAALGLREDVEPDLIRLVMILEAIKVKIVEKFNQ